MDRHRNRGIHQMTVRLFMPLCCWLLHALTCAACAASRRFSAATFHYGDAVYRHCYTRTRGDGRDRVN